MGRNRKWEDPEKKQQAILLNKVVLNKLKAYAIETDQSFESVIREPFDKFQNDLLELSRQIDQIRQNAIIANTPTSVPVEPSIIAEEPLEVAPQ